MTFWEFLSLIGLSYSVVIVSIGALIIGFVSGSLSFLFVTQKRSVLGDALAHSSLAGVAIAFLIVLEKIRLYLIVGALISSLLAVLLIILITEKTPLKQDAAIGITLSFFFSIGIALITYIQSLPLTAQSGLEHYIFGNIAFLLLTDLYSIGGLSLLTFFILTLFWKEYKLILFDREYAINLGIPVKKLEILLMFLVSLAVVLGIETMGVVLIAGILIGPAVAARQWSNKYNHLIILSGFIGGLSGVIGTISSSKISNFPTGPTIIVVLSIIVALSVLVGKENGLITHWLHTKVFHRNMDHKELLRDFANGVEGFIERDGIRILEFDLQDYPNLDSNIIDKMQNCGYCRRLSGTKCSLTYKGVQETQKIIPCELCEEDD